MIRRAFGSNVEAVATTLAEDGPACATDICRRLGLPRQQISGSLTRMRQRLAKQPKRIHVASYSWTAEGSSRRYPRAVYALGNLPDAAKPVSAGHLARFKDRSSSNRADMAPL